MTSIRTILTASQMLLFFSQGLPVTASTIASTPAMSSVGTPTISHHHEVPSFPFNDLVSGARDDDLVNVLTTTGILAIRMPLPPPQHNSAGTIATSTASSPSSSSKSLLNGLCQCKDHIGDLDGVETTLLTDDKTTRSTIATATHGTDRPLPLLTSSNNNINNNDQTMDKVCAHEGLYQNMELIRDQVSRAVGVGFVPALDRLIRRSWRPSSYRTVLPVKYGEDYYTVSSIIEDAQHLEHFHLYSKKQQQQQQQQEEEESSRVTTGTPVVVNTKNDEEENEEEMIDDALGWHKDAGLFLAFLPASSCDDDSTKNCSHDNDDDDSLRIRLPSSSSTSPEQLVEMIPSFPKQQDNELIVAIMLGNGAENWLQTPPALSLKATSHTVKMQDGHSRAWYGMMHLVPSHAIVHQDNTQSLTLSDMKQFMEDSRFADNMTDDNNKDQTHIAIGCGHSQPITATDDSSTQTLVHHQEDYPILQNRRRIGTVVDGTGCNNSTNLFCWMNCMDIPESQSIDNHFQNGESVYCLDPAVLQSTNDLKQAVDACTNQFTGVAGGIHKDSCDNLWHPTQRDVPSYLEEPNSQNQDDDDDSSLVIDDQYCWGATSMYMTGFEWESTTCVVYLFPSWVLSTRGKLAIACIGTIILGIVVELIIRQRGVTVKKMTNPGSKIAASACFYGVQLTLAYLLMLVVMTYSVPLVLCVVLGLVMGHVVTNWKLFFAKKKGTGEEKHDTADVEIVAGGPGTPCCNFDETSLNDTKKNTTTSDASDYGSTTEELCGNC